MAKRTNTEPFFVEVDRQLGRWVDRYARTEGRFKWSVAEEAFRDLKTKVIARRKASSQSQLPEEPT